MHDNAVYYDAKCKLTIFLLLPRPFLLSPSPSKSPSPSGTLWTRSRLISKMAELALAARSRPGRIKVVYPPCLRQNTPALHAKTQGATRVQQFAC